VATRKSSVGTDALAVGKVAVVQIPQDVAVDDGLYQTNP